LDRIFHQIIHLNNWSEFPRPPLVIETAKLNGLDPQAYLADIFDRIHDHKINRPDGLLPWNWVPLASVTDSQAA